MPEQRRVREVAGGDLERGQVELREQVGARLVERRREQRQAELLRAGEQLGVSAPVELERLAVLTVRGAEAVLVVVRRLVLAAGEERAVVPLLELDRVDAAIARGDEQLLRGLDRALVVVADLGDDVAVAVVRDAGAVDDEFAHGSRGSRRVADGTPRGSPDRLIGENPWRGFPPTSWASSLSSSAVPWSPSRRRSSPRP